MLPDQFCPGGNGARLDVKYEDTMSQHFDFNKILGAKLVSANTHQIDRTCKYVIKHKLLLGQVSMLVGESNLGKSAIVAATCAHIAMGRDFGGQKVARAAILYVAAEDPEGVLDRAYPYLHSLAGVASPFDVMGRAVNLLDRRSVSEFILGAKGYLVTTGCTRLMVVIDTLIPYKPTSTLLPAGTKKGQKTGGGTGNARSQDALRVLAELTAQSPDDAFEARAISALTAEPFNDVRENPDSLRKAVSRALRDLISQGKAVQEGDGKFKLCEAIPAPDDLPPEAFPR